MLLGKIHSSALQLLLALGASSTLGANHILHVSVCVLFCVEHREHLTWACREPSLQHASVLSLQQKSEMMSPSTEAFLLAGCAESFSSVCHAEGRMDTAFPRNKLQPHGKPGSDLCAGAVRVVVLVQRADPGRGQKVNAKGNWEFFKIKAPVLQGWPLQGE